MRHLANSCISLILGRIVHGGEEGGVLDKSLIDLLLSFFNKTSRVPWSSHRNLPDHVLDSCTQCLFQSYSVSEKEGFDSWNHQNQLELWLSFPQVPERTRFRIVSCTIVVDDHQNILPPGIQYSAGSSHRVIDATRYVEVQLAAFYW
ncbi:MAG: hypothetical protein U0176_21005 [Bacteroidia bacterium]